MKKNNIIKIAIVAVVIAAIGGGYYYSKSISAAKAKNAVKYTTVKAKTGSIAVTIQSTGTVSAATSDDIISSNNGLISSITVKEGDTVKKGQTIGFINDTTLQQSVDSATLKVAQDNTTIANNKTTLTQSVSAATLKVTQDNTTIANNKDPQKVESNNAQLQKDKEDLSTKTALLASASSNTSQLVQDQTDLNTKTASLAKETVTSPIDGVIVTMSFKNGDTVQSGKTIATVVDMKSLQIIVQVDELDISNVKNGQKATITFDALTGKTYTGTVSKVSQLGTTTNNVTNYAVYVAIDNPDGIKIGMNGNANITVSNKDNVITLSLDALQTINGKKYVLTSIPDTTSKSSSSSKKLSTSNMQLVTTGLTNQTDVEIATGLKAGAAVYIKMPTVSTSTTSTSKTSTSKTSNNAGSSSFGGAAAGGSMPSGGGGGGGN